MVPRKEGSWRRDVEKIRALRPQSILFLCVANSARSQMAEAIARYLAPIGIRVYSAGSIPTSPHPLAISTLGSLGIDASSQTSKSVEDLFGTSMDVVVNLCQDEVCPVWLEDSARFHWPLPDPAAGPASGQKNQFVEVCKELQRRLKVLFRH